jgi:hypothetical protein
MTALIDGEQPEPVRQWRQDAAIGQGVEAVGVQEDEIAGAIGWTEVKNSHRAPAASGQIDEAAREGGVRRGGYFFAGVF